LPLWLWLRAKRPGGDRGAGLGGFGPQSKAELAQGEHKGAREVRGRYWHDTAAPPSRGVARWGAKDPTDDPAELHDVLFWWHLMALANGRGSNATSTPGNWVEPPCTDTHIGHAQCTGGWLLMLMAWGWWLVDDCRLLDSGLGS
jgi:hypothetical protein